MNYKKFLGLGISVLAFAIIMVVGAPSKVLAGVSAPTFSSALLENYDATTVEIVISGSNFDTFVNGDSKTISTSAALSAITYGGKSPVSASIISSAEIDALFSISNIGTGKDKSGNPLDIAQ